jgi:cytochrome c oxidase assembly protein subunit 15
MVCLSWHLIDIIRGSKLQNEAKKVNTATTQLRGSLLATHWFISTKYRRSCGLTLFTFAFALVVILLGAYTRLTDAGLSCPDWPNCFGFLTAPHTPTQLQAATTHFPAAEINSTKAWTEMTHRYLAGIEGGFILLLALSILFGRRALDHRTFLIGIGLVALLAAQVTLGMLTVTERLRPEIVLSHLLVGLTILGILWWTYLSLDVYPMTMTADTIPSIKPWLWLGLAIISLQIALGGWVSTHSAGLACIDFPYCNGQLVPPLDWRHFANNLTTIHMLHRLGAVMTATYVGGLSITLLHYRPLRYLAIALLWLIIIQISLGILNIIWLRPVWTALMHHAVGILLLLTMLTILVKATFAARKQHDWV